MKKRRKILFASVLVFLLLLCIGTVLYFRQWLFVNPFQPLYMDNVIYAARDTEGNVMVLDYAGSRLLKIHDGRLLWKVDNSPDTFSSGKRVVTDGAGTVYVQSATTASGIYLRDEAIVKYSRDGKYLGEVISLDSENRLRPQIAAMIPRDEGIYWIQRMEDAVLIFDEKNQNQAVLSLPDADRMALHFAYDPVTETLWYSTYDGRILRYEPNGAPVVLYDSATVGTGKESIPREISYASGILYAVDCGMRDTIAIRTDTGEISRLTADTPVKEREIPYYLNADNGLILSSSYSVINWDGDSYSACREVELTGGGKCICSVLWVVLLFLSASAVLVGGAAFVHFYSGADRYTKINVSIVTGVLVLGLFISGNVMPLIREEHAKAIFSREEFAAAVTTEQLPVRSFMALERPSDFYREDYLAVKAAVEKVFFTDTEDAKDFYCSLYKVIDGNTTQVYALNDTCVLYPYDWGKYDETKELGEQEIISTGEGKTYMGAAGRGSSIFTMMPIFDGEIPVGIIEVGMDMSQFQQEMRQTFLSLLINILAIAVLAFFLSTELLYYAQGKKEYRQHYAPGRSAKPLPVPFLRITVFMVFFFSNLTAAILPLRVMKLAETSLYTLGLSPEVLAAIPISAEVAAGALFSIFGGKVLHALGTRRAVKVCAALFVAGLSLRIVPNIWIMTLGSVSLGTGWGVILLLVNVQISNLPAKERDIAFAYSAAAGFGGINGGVVMGGFLTQWFSYTLIFILTAVSSLAFYYIMSRYLSASPDFWEENQETGGALATIRFILSPRVLLFFLMIVTPVVMCGYFLNYLFPILGDRYGLSETYIGYSYLINGFCVTMCGPALTGFFTRTRKRRLGLFIAALLYATAFFLVARLQNIPSLLVALSLLGLSDGFGLPLQSSFFTDLEEVEEFGYDGAFGVYSLFENMAQSIGPLVFSYALLIGIGRGLMLIAIALASLALLYTAFSGKAPKVVTAQKTDGA